MMSHVGGNLRKTCSKCDFEQSVRTNKCPNCGSTLTKSGKVLGTTVAAGYRVSPGRRKKLLDIAQVVDVQLVQL